MASDRLPGDGRTKEVHTGSTPQQTHSRNRSGPSSKTAAFTSLMRTISPDPAPASSQNHALSTPISPEHDTNQISTSTPNPAAPPAFSPLQPTASRLSQLSAGRTFGDPIALVALPDLTRETTRTRRLRGNTFSAGNQIAEGREGDHEGGGSGGDSEEDGKYGVDVGEENTEVEVAVQINPDGTELTFPDGGLEAYMVLTGGVCAAFSAFGMAASIGAFQTYYAKTFLSNYSSSTIAWIGSTQAAVCFSVSVFTGPLLDKLGPKPLVASGVTLQVLAFICLSFCKEYYQVFLCHATLMALGMDLLFIVPMGIVGQWFALKRGMAFGIILTGSSAGAIVWPIIMANLPQRIGFGWTARVIALIQGALGFAAWYLLKARLPRKPLRQFFHFRAFKSLAYSCIALSFFFFTFGYFCYLFFIGTYGNLLGLGSFAPYILTITNASSGFGRITFGLVADRVGVLNTTILATTVMLLMGFIWIACKSTGPLIALGIIYGFASGAFVSLQGPMVSVVADDLQMAGTLVGQALMVQSVAQLVGPPIFGSIVGSESTADQLARFPHAIVLGGIMLVLAVLAVTAARFRLEHALWAKI